MIIVRCVVSPSYMVVHAMFMQCTQCEGHIFVANHATARQKQRS